METLKELYTGATSLSGDVALPYLAEKLDTEKAELANIHETFSTKGWAAVKDALDGEDAIAMSEAYYDRVKTTQDVDAFIRRQQEIKGIVIPGPIAETAQGHRPNEFNGKQGGAESIHTKAASMFIGHPVMASGHDGSPAKFKQQLQDVGPQMVKLDDVMPHLKAAMFTTPLPIDMVARPYPVSVNVLDYIPMRTEEGARMFYHQPPIPQFGTVDLRGNTREYGAEIPEAMLDWTLVDKKKESIANYAPIAREAVQANINVMPAAMEQLIVDLRAKMVQQIINGVDGTTDQWQGMVGELTGRTAGIEQLFDLSAATEPVQQLETLIVNLFARGTPATAILCGLADWTAIRNSQRRFFQGGFDYMAGPMGNVAGVPLVPNNFMPANTIIVGSFMPETFEVVLGMYMETGVSDDYAFRNNQIAMRSTVHGNCAYKRPYGLIRLTGTNNFQFTSA